MNGNKFVLSVCCVLALATAGCSRQESDWQKTREANTTESYEQFLKKYPTGEFTGQAEARVKELYEARDWQKARDLDTPEAYQAFLKQYPEGKWTEEARIRVENFTLAQAPSGVGTPSAGGTDSGGTPVGTATQPPADATIAAATPPAPPPSSPAAAAARKPASKPSAPAKPASGAYAVQLGAFKSGAGAAHERWAQLQKEYPSLLAGLSSKVLPMKAGSGSLYRLQATGLTEKHARAICGSLTAKSEACIVVSPAAG